MIKSTLSIALFGLLLIGNSPSAFALQDDSEAKPKTEQAEDNKKQESDGDKTEKESKAEKKKQDDEADKQDNVQTDGIGRLRQYSRSSKSMIEVFKPVAASVSESTVSIMSGDKQVALGTIIDSNGFILTKASELNNRLTVYAAGKKYEAKVFGVHKPTDLAMLKIEASELPTANIAPVASPLVGSWLAAPGPQEDPFMVSIVAVEARKIKSAGAFVGITPVKAADRDGVRINTVVPDAPADKANLLVNDIIIKIDEHEIKDPNALRATLAKFEPGDRIELTVIRGEETFKVGMELADRNTFDNSANQFERTNQQNRMGSRLSERRMNFPFAFQHDGGINANQCGGPIVDLSGKIVGINISRAERVSSLALPVEAVIPVITELKTGQLSPSIINSERIAQIDDDIVDLQDQLKGLPERQQKLKLENGVREARRAELNQLMKELESRLAELDEGREEEEAELEKLRKDIFTFKRRIRRLEGEKDKLQNGFGE